MLTKLNLKKYQVVPSNVYNIEIEFVFKVLDTFFNLYCILPHPQHKPSLMSLICLKILGLLNVTEVADSNLSDVISSKKHLVLKYPSLLCSFSCINHISQLLSI